MSEPGSPLRSPSRLSSSRPEPPPRGSSTAPRGIPAAVAAAVPQPGDPEVGKTVFFIAGCESCHMSPGQKDPLQLGGGMELKTPFGSFYPPNISPDPNDGIGSWSAAEFADAVMAGVSPGGEHLYPALPYTSYCRMSEKDVRDLYAFLRTTPPVSGRAPPNALPFPFSIRRAIGFWKLLYMPKIDPPAVDPTEPGGARPLSGRGARTLRGMPFAPRPFRRQSSNPAG